MIHSNESHRAYVVRFLPDHFCYEKEKDWNDLASINTYCPKCSGLFNARDELMGKKIILVDLEDASKKI